jgi:hypothetical protein
MLPFIITMSLAIAGLIALGFYFHFRRGMSPTTIIRMYLTRVLTIFALVFVLIGIRAPFHAGSIKEVHWSFVAANLVFGVFLGFCAARIGPNE